MLIASARGANRGGQVFCAPRKTCKAIGRIGIGAKFEDRLRRFGRDRQDFGFTDGPARCGLHRAQIMVELDHRRGRFCFWEDNSGRPEWYDGGEIEQCDPIGRAFGAD